MTVKKDSFDPPSYDELTSFPEGNPGLNISYASPPPTPGLSSSSYATSPGSVSPTSSSTWSSWIPWNKTKNEVNNNVHNLVRQIVIGMGNLNAASSTSNSSASAQQRGGDVAEVTEGILHSCADACAKHLLSLASILQDRYIEGHSPLYWAIVNQPSSRSDRTFGGDQKTVDIFGVLLAYSLPMTRGSTISELRLACLSMSNQSAFQRLRLTVPTFSSLSGTDRILLGSAALESDIDVTLGSESDGGAFAVDIRFPQFHKRLMINREVGVEFVVRNRIWQFSLMFMKYNWSEGPTVDTWGATLSLQDSSSPTWFDGRLILIDPKSGSREVTSEATTSQSQDTLTGLNFVRMRSRKEYRLEASSDQRHQIAVSLEDNPAFSSLQYAETSYISADGILTLRLEARLTKPSAEPSDDCTIC